MSIKSWLEKNNYRETNCCRTCKWAEWHYQADFDKGKDPENCGLLFQEEPDEFDDKFALTSLELYKVYDHYTCDRWEAAE